MMYHKFIGDREVFSTCKTLHTEEGWISNPTPEQIAADGWTEYIPPVVPPTPQTEPGMDDIIQAVKKMLSQGAEQLSDQDALEVAALYPTWASKVGKEVEKGQRLWWNGELWKATQYIKELLKDWTPDVAVSLFTRVSLAEIPEWVQPTGAQDAYMKGDKVHCDGQTWVSTVDNNTWKPGVYGWDLI